MRERLRIVIAEDNYLVREGTRRLLEDSGEVDVLASVSTAEELLEVVDGLRPDVVLTDIRMPPAHHLEGIQAAHSIRQRHPRIGVVVLSQHSDATYALQLFKSGTEGLGYLLKSRVGELDELLHALREVAAGRSVIDPGVVERLVDYQARQTESPCACSASAKSTCCVKWQKANRTPQSQRLSTCPNPQSRSTSTRSSRSSVCPKSGR